jgi:hypothetical protein
MTRTPSHSRKGSHEDPGTQLLRPRAASVIEQRLREILLTYRIELSVTPQSTLRSNRAGAPPREILCFRHAADMDTFLQLAASRADTEIAIAIEGWDEIPGFAWELDIRRTLSMENEVDVKHPYQLDMEYVVTCPRAHLETLFELELTKH